MLPRAVFRVRLNFSTLGMVGSVIQLLYLLHNSFAPLSDSRDSETPKGGITSSTSSLAILCLVVGYCKCIRQLRKEVLHHYDMTVSTVSSWKIQYINAQDWEWERDRYGSRGGLILLPVPVHDLAKLTAS